MPHFPFRATLAALSLACASLASAASFTTGTANVAEDFVEPNAEEQRQIAADEPQRCALIDANADPVTVAASIWAALRDRFFAANNGAGSA